MVDDDGDDLIDHEGVDNGTYSTSISVLEPARGELFRVALTCGLASTFTFTFCLVVW